ncbi:MAG: zinc ABC transporter substrate-binding protein [Proteobacteria bacterium]|nr:zinc ABC transporter substrate-binding protein [Pseudomonadota bacterium]
MRIKKKFLLVIVAMVLVCFFTGCSNKSKEGSEHTFRSIVTSDTILSGMIASLLPRDCYSVEAILPPGQCPGHYDVKLTDIEKIKKAALNVSFRGMLFMDKAGVNGGAQLPVDAGSHNWMAPDSYIYGLGLLADGLSKRFPEDKAEIMRRKEQTIREVREEANSLLQRVRQAGIFGKPIIASSMQKEPLEWMGFRIVGEYGRPEAMSTREFVRLSKIGKDQHAIIVVDNLQSGPDVGKGIAEILGLPHVVLTNFPSEKGYLTTLGDNVNTVLKAAMRK